MELLCICKDQSSCIYEPLFEGNEHHHAPITLSRRQGAWTNSNQLRTLPGRLHEWFVAYHQGRLQLITRISSEKQASGGCLPHPLETHFPHGTCRSHLSCISTISTGTLWSLKFMNLETSTFSAGGCAIISFRKWFRRLNLGTDVLPGRRFAVVFFASVCFSFTLAPMFDKRFEGQWTNAQMFDAE